MYQRDTAWEKYLERFGFKDDLSGGLQRKNTPPVRLASFAVIISPPNELDFLIQRNLTPSVVAIDLHTVSPEGLRANFDWAMGSLLWRLELQRPALIEISGRETNDTMTAVTRRKAELSYQTGAFSDALTGLEACSGEGSDFSLNISLGHLYLYHRRPAELDKARQAYLRAVNAAPNNP